MRVGGTSRAVLQSRVAAIPSATGRAISRQPRSSPRWITLRCRDVVRTTNSVPARREHVSPSGFVERGVADVLLRRPRRGSREAGRTRACSACTPHERLRPSRSSRRHPCTATRASPRLRWAKTDWGRTRSRLHSGSVTISRLAHDPDADLMALSVANTYRHVPNWPSSRTERAQFTAASFLRSTSASFEFLSDLPSMSQNVPVVSRAMKSGK